MGVISTTPAHKGLIFKTTVHDENNSFRENICKSCIYKGVSKESSSLFLCKLILIDQFVSGVFICNEN